MAQIIQVETIAKLLDHDGRVLFSVTDTENASTHGDMLANGETFDGAATNVAARIGMQFNTRFGQRF